MLSFLFTKWLMQNQGLGMQSDKICIYIVVPKYTKYPHFFRPIHFFCKQPAFSYILQNFLFVILVWFWDLYYKVRCVFVNTTMLEC